MNLAIIGFVMRIEFCLFYWELDVCMAIDGAFHYGHNVEDNLLVKFYT